jgi:GNAT superfamily N-acetyltransferase
LIESVRPLLAGQPFLPGHHLPGALPDALVQAALIRLASEDEDNLVVRAEKGRLTGLAVMRPLPWDTEFFQMGCARVEAFYPDRTDEAALDRSRALAAEVVDWCRRRGVRFASAKIEAADALSSLGLGRSGFDVVDTELTLITDRTAPSVAPMEPPPGIEIVAGDGLTGVSLAALGGLYEYSRFHADPRVGPELADRLWGLAVNNQAAREGRPVVLLVEGDRAVGIISCRPEADLAAITGAAVGDWFMVGVAPGYRRRGLGRTLLAAALAQGLERYDLIQVSTQAYSPGAVHFFLAGGFRLCRAGLSLHCFVED